MRKVILTGSTGMVGEGVLHQCLNHPMIEKVLVVNRSPCGIVHAKLEEIIHRDFFDLKPIAEQLQGYDTCFFCLGVSSVGLKEPEYYRLTYTLTLHFATILKEHNTPVTFCYISGAHTDSTEKGRSMWARVKGKTENDLQKMFGADFYAFRPGYIHPIKGLKRVHTFYKWIGWIYPIGVRLFPGGFCRLEELGSAMINVALKGYPRQVLEGRDIHKAAL